MRNFTNAGATALLICAAGCTTSLPPLPDPLEAGWNGRPVCEVLHQDKQQRVLKCQFAPGVGHERHYHRPHFGYALTDGRMRIRDDEGERVVDVKAGTSWHSDEVTVHDVLNVGDTTGVYLIVEPR